jgi:hypothetical protein
LGNFDGYENGLKKKEPKVEINISGKERRKVKTKLAFRRAKQSESRN